MADDSPNRAASRVKKDRGDIPAKSRDGSPNRGRGIYFSDDEYEQLLEEVALQGFEARKPTSISEVVRQFVRDGIERNQAKRAKREQGTQNG